jgi:diamine N-acetyltransferase
MGESLMLTLTQIVQNPRLLTEPIMTKDDETLIIRPLESSDTHKLAEFLQNLSIETRRLSAFPSYEIEIAQELCDAIARYDKLRFVLETVSKQLAGLLEFSFDLVDHDIERYRSYSLQLHQDTDCRFGPTLADEYQNKGVGTLVMPFIKTVACQFEQKRIILLGGVLGDNPRAIRFYEKTGFRRVGIFKNNDDVEVIDMILEL